MNMENGKWKTMSECITHVSSARYSLTYRMSFEVSFDIIENAREKIFSCTMYNVMQHRFGD